jgi:hypothetical protein
MSAPKSEKAARYEARREAAPAVIIAALVLMALALVSRKKGWELVDLPWWIWLVLAVPGLLVCVDLWLGTRGIVELVRTRLTSLVLLGVVVLGNLIGVVVLVAGLVTTGNDNLGGGQLLFTAAAIWTANVIVFGMCFWDVDDGGPFERVRPEHERSTPDIQFPQDENPELARDDWHPRIWDYMYMSLTSASAFSPTDAMPLTLRAKLLMGTESTVSLVLIVLVTARAVNVLGS